MNGSMISHTKPISEKCKNEGKNETEQEDAII